MKIKKHIITGFLIFLLFSIPILLSIYINKLSPNVAELIENENMDDLSLTIHYMNPGILTVFALSIDDLINRDHNKIVISGSELEEHIDLFKQISNEFLIPVIMKTSVEDYRMYYVLESKKNGKLLEVAMWGDGQSIFVNGLEVKGKDIFYKVIMPFLPEDEVKRFWDLRVDNE